MTTYAKVLEAINEKGATAMLFEVGEEEIRHALRMAAMVEAGEWKVVPINPTKEMVLAGETAVENNIDEASDSYCSYEIYEEHVLASAAYKAMINNAPEWEG